MPVLEEGDEVTYNTSFYGKGKATVVAWDEGRGMYMVLPHKNVGMEFLFCYPNELVATPF